MQTLELMVLEADEGKRLDSFISGAAGLSRSLVQGLVEQGHVLVNGTMQPKRYRLRQGDVLRVSIPEPTPIEAVAQDIPLDIVYEDADLLVVNKPKGMVVHPAAGNPDGTLVNALLHHCGGSLSGIGGEIRPGIVHRIDKDTSGLLVVAKNDDTHTGLSEQFARHTIHRQYQSVVYGGFKQDSGTVDAALARSRLDRKKIAVAQQGGKTAITHYTVLARYNGFTHLAQQLETGRTHQIRVHMAHIGHPVAGDAIYGPKHVIKALQGQCLHAKQIGFTHPKTGDHMLFDSELPLYFSQFLNTLREE